MLHLRHKLGSTVPSSFLDLLRSASACALCVSLSACSSSSNDDSGTSTAEGGTITSTATMTGDGDGDGDGAARSMFIDGECVPVAPEAAPFVPLLCSNSRLPPALLRGPLRDSPALRRLVEELLRRDFLSVDMDL